MDSPIMTRTRGHKRNYRDLSEGPINSQLLQDVAKQTRVRRASAGSNTSDEPPRKRGRPAQKALTVDPNSISPASSKSDDMMIDIPAVGTLVLPDSPVAEDHEGMDSFGYFVTSVSTPPESPSSTNAQARITSDSDKPDVNIFSPVEEVAALLMDVAEQARLKFAEQALAAQNTKDIIKTHDKQKTKKKGKAKKGRSRR